MSTIAVPQGDRLKAVIEEANRLDAVDLLALYYLVQHAIPTAEFPRLIVGRRVVLLEDEDVTTNTLSCPHCFAVLTEEIDGDVNLIAVDTAERWTAWASTSFEEHDVQFSYDSSADYQGLLYRCGECQAPVRLPENWSER